MKTQAILFGLCLSAFGAGCSTATTAAPAPATPAATAMAGGEKADSKHLTDFQKSRLIGHYSTEDGKSGFVIDLSDENAPKARLDGDTAVKVLKKRGSVSGAYELVSDDHKFWVRMNAESGDVMLFQGPKQHEGVDVVRDADADQLK